MTRRRLLGSAAGVAGAAAALSVLPPGLQKAVAAGVPRRGGLADVRHVVMLMQENRSFDHYFGTLAGVRGFGDPRALRLPDGRSVFYQPDSESPDGYALPFHLDTTTTCPRPPSPRSATTAGPTTTTTSPTSTRR